MSSPNKSKIIRGDTIKINDFISIQQPDINKIIDFDEQKFFSVFYSLCSIASDMKSALWDMGVDWNTLSDWNLFISTCRGYSKDDTCLIFGDIDFSKYIPLDFKPKDSDEDTPNEKVLVEAIFDENGNPVDLIPEHMIREQDYNNFIPYIREMFGYQPKVEKAANKVTKMALIDEDRIKRKQNSKKEWDSTLLPMIVSLVNTEEFKYNYETVMNLTLYQLMKSFMQIQNKKSACAMYQGSMSGFVDTSKIDKKAFNWIYSNE